MVTFANQQGYSRNDGPSQWVISPSQPMFGTRNMITGNELTIFQYDVISPYGVGVSVSNTDQTSRVMVGWGLKLIVSLLSTVVNVTLRIYLNSGVNTTFTQVDTSPVVLIAGAKWQTVTAGPFAMAQIKGTLQAMATDTDVEYHVRLIEAS